MHLFNVMIILGLLIFPSGCATIMHGTTQNIEIKTDPADANLLVDGKDKYKSPATITMSRKDAHMVEVSKEGYQKETIKIQQTMSLATLGDVFAGGAIGYIVDAASGAQCRLIPDNVDIHLQPLNPKALPPAPELR